MKSARIKENTDANETVEEHSGKDIARNLANKAGKAIFAARNHMSGGKESRKGIVDSRNCSLLRGGNAG